MFQFLLRLDPLELLLGATFGFKTELFFTFFKIFEGLFLEVLEEIQPEPLLQAVAVESEQTLQPVPAGGEEEPHFNLQSLASESTG